MADSSAERDPLDRLAEEFVTRYRAGERPSLDEFADRHPELADQIRDLFPALVEMEQLKPVSADLTGPYAAEAAPLGPVPGFRILREIGRGGMGVVYEAVQEALGRHVALKVLPERSAGDAKRRERFRREARAAARLHHTNIVPVFQTGEGDGVHYYAMQFIAGTGLDQVVVELRRLRDAGASAPARTPAPPGEPPAARLARSLITKSFEEPPGADTRTFDPAHDGPTLTSPGAPEPEAPPAPASPAPGPESSLVAGGGRRYWESVARIGTQAAGALAHAHGQGVLHRDIKPSNLLLDANGTLWVTDFGLAKTADDDDLTGTGDILGTLRYMAPERFEGRCDARADIYALGLTLYELLTLRPAFDETGREKLVALVTQGQPARPSKLNPKVPRDLETIVLKAIAREPEARYQSAAELAEDLECFLQDRPIRARRASTVHRFVRWSRRNPVVAGLTVALVLVLGLVAVGSTAAALSYRDLADRETKARGRAETNELLAQENERKIADALDRQNRANALFESGLRHSKRSEWPEALAAFTRAAELKPDNSQVWSDRGGLLLKLGLAEEAAADFAKLFELRQPDDPAWWVFHAALRLQVGDRAGYLAVCRDVRRHFPGADNPDALRAIVQTHALAPGGCPDPAELVRLVEAAADRFPTEPFGEQHVAALFRAGRHQDVVAATNPATAGTAAERAQRPAVLCFRAMSLAKLNNVPTAREVLGTARDKLDASATLLSGQPFGPLQGDRFVGTFPPVQTQDGTIDWVIDDLIWREAGAAVAPDPGPHPLPLLVRARGCAAIGRWAAADAASRAAEQLATADPKQPRLLDVVLLERLRLSAARGNWPEVTAGAAAALAATKLVDGMHNHLIELYTAYGRHDDARRQLSDRITALEARGQYSGQLDVELKQRRARNNIQLQNWDAAAADLVAVLNSRTYQPFPERSYRGIGGGWGGGFFDSYFPGYNKVSFGGGYASQFFPRPGGIPAGPSPPNPTGESARAEIHRDIVLHDELYARVSALRPTDTELRRHRGNHLTGAKRWEDAKRFYLDWLEHPPKPQYDPAPRPGETQADARRTALFRLLSTEIAAADPVFEAVVEKYPRAEPLWTARYNWFVRNKDYDRAAEAVLHTLPDPPVLPPAGTHAPSMQYTTAVSNEEVFRRLVARRPADGNLWMARFRAHNVSGKDWERAAVEVVKLCGDRPQWVRDAAHALARTPAPERVEEVYAEVLKARPNDPDVLAGQCLLLVRKKKWDEAAAAFESALKALPPPGPTVDPQLTPRNLYDLVLGDETTFAEFVKRRPKDGQLLTVYASRMVAAGKDPVPTLLKATELNPKDAVAWLELGRLHAMRRRWADAAAAYDKHLSLLPPQPLLPPQVSVSRGSGVYAEVVGNLVGGPKGPTLPLLNAVLALRPNDARLRQEQCRFWRGAALNPNNAAARTELEAAFEGLIKCAPKDPIAWLERGRYRMSTRDQERAALDYAAAGKLFPRRLFDKQYWPLMFPMYTDVARNPAVFAAYTKAAPDDPLPWHFRGWQRRDPFHPDHATWYDDFSRAIELDPSEPGYRNFRRWGALDLGEWGRAADECAAEIARPDGRADDMVWMTGGCALAAHGPLRRYREYCRRMAEAWGEPDTPVRKQRFVMTQLLHPNPALDAGKMVEYAQSAFDDDPKAWWNTFTLGLAQVRAGRPGKVLGPVTEYLRTPGDPTRWGVQDRLALQFLLAVALARDGKPTDARAVFDDGCKKMDEALYDNGTRKLMSSGHVWAACEVLRREADGLINTVAPQPRPGAGNPK